MVLLYILALIEIELKNLQGDSWDCRDQVV
jgi:hypothetical protein